MLCWHDLEPQWNWSRWHFRPFNKQMPPHLAHQVLCHSHQTVFTLWGWIHTHTYMRARTHTHTHTHWHTSIWNGNLSDTFPTFGDTVLAFPLSDSLIGGLAFQGVSPSSIRFYNGRGSLAELYFTPWALNQKRRTKEQFSERCSADSHDTDWTK